MLSFDGYFKSKNEKLRLLRGDNFTLIVGSSAEVVIVMCTENGAFIDKWRINILTSIGVSPIESKTFASKAEAEETAIKEVFGR